MSTTTTKLGLTKPDPTENVDIAVINTNMDVVDAAFAGIVGAYKNRIRNGDFSVAQRGRAAFTAVGMTLDGWRQNFSGGTLSTTGVVNTLGNPAHADGAKYGMQAVIASQAAAGDFVLFEHRIEGVETLAGKQVTLSFKAKASTGTPKIGVEVTQFFGSTGAPSASVNTVVSAVTISTTEAGYSVTFTVPSITGKTLGTDGNDYLAINLWLSSGSTNAARASNVGFQNITFTLYDVQLETGSIATAFERLPQQVQLAWNQRYFWRFVAGSVGNMASGFCHSATASQYHVMIPTTMRAVPAVSLFGSASNWQVDIAAGGGSQIACTAISFDRASPQGCRAIISVAAGLTAGQGTLLSSTSTTAGFDFTAEL